MSDPVFFETSAAFRDWLANHHQQSSEIIVGYWKKATGKPSVTWEETVDEALCHGWIDGVRKSLGDEAYTVRFTPRRPGSIWSQRNLNRIEALRTEGRMKAAGIQAWETRKPETRGYSAATRIDEFPPDMQDAFGDAWAFHEAQPTGYRAQVTDWVLSAKRQETVQRRLRALIGAARNGVRLDMGRPFEHLEDGT